MSEQDLRKTKGLVYLSAIFISALITSTLIGSKLILLGPITLSAGVFVFPFTFLSLDICADCFGKDAAKMLIRLGIVVQIFVLFFVWLGGKAPPSPVRDIGVAYNQVFSLTSRMVLASITAYFVSQTFDISVFLGLKEKTKGRFLWLRTNTATLCSQLVDTVIFSFIFLFGVMPVNELLKATATVYAAKVILGFIDTPFVYLGRALIMKGQTK